MQVALLTMTECFVCLQETSTRSPCECGAAVHEHCLMLALARSESQKCSICKTDLRNVTKKHVKVMNRQAVVIIVLLALSALSLVAIAVAFLVHSAFSRGSSVGKLQLTASVFLVVAATSGAAVAWLCRTAPLYHAAVRVQIEWV